MKNKFLAVALCLAAMCCLLLSCANAVVNDGTQTTGCSHGSGANGTSIYPAPTGGSSSGGSSSGGGGSSGGGDGNWNLCKNSSYDIFDMQVWGDGAGTFGYDNTNCRFTVLTKGGGWVGGGLVPADLAKSIDFSGVSKMVFEIRGTIAANALCIAVQSSASMYPGKNALNSSAGLTLSENEWKQVEFSISGAASDTIINAFCILVAADWGGSFSEGDWFEVRNLDWVDASGNSVTLKLK